MKKILAVLLVFCLMLPFVANAEKAKVNKEAKKPKKGNEIKVSAKQFKPGPEIVKNMVQYKAIRKKQAKVMATFSFVQQTMPGEQGQPQTAIFPLSQEEHCVPIISGKLGALLTFLESQNDKGHGDLDYWIRTRSLLAMEGNIAVGELNRILEVHGAAMNGLLRASVKYVSGNLAQAMSKYNSGYGDLDFWVAASGNTRDALWQAAANIKEIREAIGSPNAANVVPLVKGQLEVVNAILRGQGDQGHGDIDYWIRTRTILATQAHVCVRILRIILDHYGPQLQGLLKSAISNIANNLDEVGGKYSNGYGDLDYWVGASRFTRDGCHAGSRNLTDILNSI